MSRNRSSNRENNRIKKSDLDRRASMNQSQRIAALKYYKIMAVLVRYPKGTAFHGHTNDTVPFHVRYAIPHTMYAAYIDGSVTIG
jgi:hypothetical protein